MARQTQRINVGSSVRETWKVDGAVTDNDIGKPVKLSATDLMVICSDGNMIEGWIDSIEPASADGKRVCTILRNGRIKAILSGAADAIGQEVEAAANTAAGTANAGNYALVSKHIPDVTTTTTLRDTTFIFKWRIISGALTDGATVLLEAVN